MNPSDPGQGLSNYLSSYQGADVAPVDVSAMQQQAAPAAPKGPGGIEGWLEKNASTIGSVALPVAADLFTGGAATGLDPLLAGIGGSVGQEVQNKTTGSKTNPLEEGLLSAGLDFGGGVAGKGIAKLASKGASVANKYGTHLLAQVGGGLDKGASRMLDAPGTVNFMTQLGIKPQDYGTTSQKLMDIINPLVKKGISSANPVDTTGLHDIVDNIVNGENGIQGFANESGTPAFKIATNLKNSLSKLSGVANPGSSPLTKSTENGLDILSPQADAGNVSDFIDSLNKDVATTAKKYKNTPQGMPTDLQALNNVKSQLAQHLEQRLYTNGDYQLEGGQLIKGAGADNALSKGLVDQETIDNLTKLLPNTPMAKRYISAIKNADTIGELRSAMVPFLNASKMSAIKEAAADTAGTTNIGAVKKPLEIATGVGGVLASGATGGASMLLPAAELALGTDTGKTLLGRTLTGNNPLGKFLHLGADNSGAVKLGRNMLIPGEEEPKMSAQNVISHLARKSLTNSIQQTLPRTAIELSKVNNQKGSGGVTNVVDTAVNEALSSMPSTAQIENGSNGATSAQTFQQMLAQYGTNGLSQYMQYLKMTQPELSGEQQTNWVQGQTLLSRIKQVAQLYSQSGAGPIKGELSSLSGFLGTKSGSAAQDYNAQRDELATSIVRYINEGGRSGGSQLTNMLRQELPTINDSANTAAAKFATLVQAITVQMQNNLAAPATNTPGLLSSFAGSQPSGGSAGTPAQASSNILNFLPPSSVNTQ